MHEFRSLFTRTFQESLRESSVTIQVLLSEISLEQRALFRRTFRMKRNFTMISIVSLSQRLKFRVRQAQQFFTRSNQSARHITFAKYTKGFQHTP